MPTLTELAATQPWCCWNEGNQYTDCAPSRGDCADGFRRHHDEYLRGQFRCGALASAPQNHNGPLFNGAVPGASPAGDLRRNAPPPATSTTTDIDSALSDIARDPAIVRTRRSSSCSSCRRDLRIRDRLYPGDHSGPPPCRSHIAIALTGSVISRPVVSTFVVDRGAYRVGQYSKIRRVSRLL